MTSRERVIYRRKLIKAFQKEYGVEDCTIYTMTVKRGPKYPFEAAVWQANLHTYLIAFTGTPTKIDLIKSIAHEMKHVQQFRRGKLKVRKYFFYWKGEKYLNREWSYFDMPHEKEAWKTLKTAVKIAEKYRLYR
jgi:hypothetical protein